MMLRVLKYQEESFSSSALENAFVPSGPPRFRTTWPHTWLDRLAGLARSRLTQSGPGSTVAEVIQVSRTLQQANAWRRRRCALLDRNIVEEFFDFAAHVLDRALDRLRGCQHNIR